MTFNPKDHIIMLPGRGVNPPQEYLPVKARIAWFREDYPEGTIETEALTLTEDLSIFRATVRKVFESLVMGSATGHGSETRSDFKDHTEKAETKAVGRALAALGFGTQFTDDLDEGDRIVDSPIQRPVVNGNSTSANAPLRQQVQQPRPEPQAYTGGSGDPTRKPTAGQVKFLEDLLTQLGYQMSEEEFTKLSFDSARERIETLKEERDMARSR